MINILKSEFYKIKHTWLIWVHIIIPILYSVTFFVATRVTSLNNFGHDDIIQNFLVVLSSVLPIIVSMVTSKVVDIEESAGHFQVILSQTKSRVKAYIGKYIVLLIGSVFFISIAITIFAILYNNQTSLDWLIEALLIFVGSLPVYLIHLLVSIKFGSSASIGLGFVETLLALLSMTSLGDKIWYYLPSTWSSRLCTIFVVGKTKLGILYINNEFMKWCLIAILIMIFVLAISLVWFSRWDGKSYTD